MSSWETVSERMNLISGTGGEEGEVRVSFLWRMSRRGIVVCSCSGVVIRMQVCTYVCRWVGMSALCVNA